MIYYLELQQLIEEEVFLDLFSNLIRTTLHLQIRLDHDQTRPEHDQEQLLLINFKLFLQEESFSTQWQQLEALFKIY